MVHEFNIGYVLYISNPVVLTWPDRWALVTGLQSSRTDRHTHREIILIQLNKGSVKGHYVWLGERQGTCQGELGKKSWWLSFMTDLAFFKGLLDRDGCVKAQGICKGQQNVSYAGATAWVGGTVGDEVESWLLVRV